MMVDNGRRQSCNYNYYVITIAVAIIQYNTTISMMMARKFGDADWSMVRRLGMNISNVMSGARRRRQTQTSISTRPPQCAGYHAPRGQSTSRPPSNARCANAPPRPAPTSAPSPRPRPPPSSCPPASRTRRSTSSSCAGGRSACWANPSPSVHTSIPTTRHRPCG